MTTIFLLLGKTITQHAVLISSCLLSREAFWIFKIIRLKLAFLTQSRPIRSKLAISKNAPAIRQKWIGANHQHFTPCNESHRGRLSYYSLRTLWPEGKNKRWRRYRIMKTWWVITGSWHILLPCQWHEATEWQRVIDLNYSTEGQITREWVWGKEKDQLHTKTHVYMMAFAHQDQQYT